MSVLFNLSLHRDSDPEQTIGEIVVSTAFPCRPKTMNMQLMTDSHELISSMKKIFFHAADDIEAGMGPEPLQAKLYSSDQMGHLGRELASTHVLNPHREKDRRNKLL